MIAIGVPAESAEEPRIGLSPETAKKLHVSPATVKTQLRVARARLGAKTTAHAVGIAVSLDMI